MIVPKGKLGMCSVCLCSLICFFPSLHLYLFGVSPTIAAWQANKCQGVLQSAASVGSGREGIPIQAQYYIM